MVTALPRKCPSCSSRDCTPILGKARPVLALVVAHVFALGNTMSSCQGSKVAPAPLQDQACLSSSRGTRLTFGMYLAHVPVVAVHALACKHKGCPGSNCSLTMVTPGQHYWQRHMSYLGNIWHILVVVVHALAWIHLACPGSSSTYPSLCTRGLPRQ